MSRGGLDLNLNRSTGGINVFHSATNDHRLVGTILVKPVILLEPVDREGKFLSRSLPFRLLALTSLHPIWNLTPAVISTFQYQQVAISLATPTATYVPPRKESCNFQHGSSMQLPDQLLQKRDLLTTTCYSRLHRWTSEHYFKIIHAVFSFPFNRCLFIKRLPLFWFHLEKICKQPPMLIDK